MGRPSIASTADLCAQETQASSWYNWRPAQREERVCGLMDLLLFLQIWAGCSPSLAPCAGPVCLGKRKRTPGSPPCLSVWP